MAGMSVLVLGLYIGKQSSKLQPPVSRLSLQSHKHWPMHSTATGMEEDLEGDLEGDLEEGLRGVLEEGLQGPQVAVTQEKKAEEW